MLLISGGSSLIMVAAIKFKFFIFDILKFILYKMLCLISNTSNLSNRIPFKFIFVFLGSGLTLFNFKTFKPMRILFCLSNRLSL